MLSTAELKSRFERVVVPRYLEPQKGRSSDHPSVVFVGGQPGAGKSATLERLRRSRPGSVTINGDELRMFHPDYAKLMREQPLRMPAVTARASGAWVAMCNDYLRERGVSAAIETTLRRVTLLLGELEKFRGAGFHTELHIVAVYAALSRVSILSRFIEQIRDTGAGRWTPSELHDATFHTLPGSVRELSVSGLLDVVVVKGRDQRVQGKFITGSRSQNMAAEAVALVKRAQDTRWLTQEAAAAWVEVTITALQHRTDLQLSAPDIRRVAKRLSSIDATEIVPRAFPSDTAAQQIAMSRLIAANLAP